MTHDAESDIMLKRVASGEAGGVDLEDLKGSKKTIGTKQTMKAVQKGLALRVYVASDADPFIINPLLALCQELNVPVVPVESMAELGRACSIDVGTASVAVVK